MLGSPTVATTSVTQVDTSHVNDWLACRPWSALVAELSIITVNLYVRVAPAANVVNPRAGPAASVASVFVAAGAAHAAAATGTTHVGVPTTVSSSIVTSTLPQNPAVSVPAYGLVVAFAAAAHAPAVNVNVAADDVPMFFKLTVEDAATPGTALVPPPYLLIVAQVPALVPITLPDDKHVVAPWFSCSNKVPDATELAVLLMLAVNPDSVPVTLKANTAVAANPVTTRTTLTCRRRPSALNLLITTRSFKIAVTTGVPQQNPKVIGANNPPLERFQHPLITTC